MTASNSIGETIVTANLKVNGKNFVVNQNEYSFIDADILLPILVEKPTFLLKPEDKVIHDYQDVETKIKVTGIPRPTVQWLRNGKPIDTNTIEPKSQTPKNRINTIGDNQLSSDFYVTHFSPDDADT